MSVRNGLQNTNGSLLDEYRPLEMIGSGSFGVIRKVQRISDGKIFARKELDFGRMTEKDRAQLVAEINILRTLQHENIVQYEERFIDNQSRTCYIIMEYCEGGDLGAVIKKCQKDGTLLPEETIWSYLAQMVSGLDACHYRGSMMGPGGRPASPAGDPIFPPTAVLHRDLKPENVFLDKDQHIKLGDFGLSKEIEQQALASTYVGTPYYMSPEQSTGTSYSVKADIWSLGCITYELCAQAPPFNASTQAELTRKIKLGQIDDLPDLYSNELNLLIKDMLHLDPERRPTTKDLLREGNIQFCCRTISLTTLTRKVSAEKVRLETLSYQLESKNRAVTAREHAVFRRERELSAIRASSSRDLEREVELNKREKTIEARERAFKLMKQKWEQQIAKAKTQASEEKVLANDSSEEEAVASPSREKLSSNNNIHHVSSAARRPTMLRKVSSNTVSRVRSTEGTVEVVHVRPVLITPRSHKVEAARQRFGKVAALANIQSSRQRRVDSIGSEEWINSEGEAEVSGKSLESSHGEPKELASRSRRQSCAAVNASQGRGEKADEPLERFSSRRSSRKSIIALPPAARAWVNEVIKANEGDDQDISMRDVSTHIVGEDKENSYRHLEMGLEKRQSLPAANIHIEPTTRPALVSRATVSTQATNGAIDGAIMPTPLYDLSNDVSLPSPFLRKVTRQNNEELAKRVAKGSNLVGPSNFLARAAAAGAARQSMAIIKDNEQKQPVQTVVRILPKVTSARRKSTRSPSPSSVIPVPAVRAPSPSMIPVRSKSRSPSPTNSHLALAPTTTTTNYNPAVDFTTLAPLIKRRSSAIPGTTTAPTLKTISSARRKSCLPSATTNITVPLRQRAL